MVDRRHRLSAPRKLYLVGRAWAGSRLRAHCAARAARDSMVEAKDVVVIGGGFAGLSAGVALAERGFRVAVLERKPALGGRAYSFADTETGDFVDNGQHVLMGCYTETLDFLRPNRFGGAIWCSIAISKSRCSSGGPAAARRCAPRVCRVPCT